MRFLLLALLLPGCAASEPWRIEEAQSVDGGLLLHPSDAQPLFLRLPSGRWGTPPEATVAICALAAAVSHAGALYALKGRHDHRTGGSCAELWVTPPGIALQRLSGPETALGVVEAGGRLFVYGSRLWILDEARGRLEVVPLPWGHRVRVRIDAAGRSCAAGCGGCLGILGTLFTPAGPDPGWQTLLDAASTLR